MSRTVVITGASSGIGAALAHRLHARGDTVAICARRGERLAEVPAALWASVDVGDRESLVAFAATVEREFGHVDVLVNNAGSARRRRMQAIEPEEFDETMRVNFWSAVHLTSALLPGMLARNEGTIVNVSSMGTRVIAARTGAYTAAKAALNHYTEALHVDLIDTGVRAKLFIPGSTATEFSVPKDGNDEPFPMDPRSIMSAEDVAEALERCLEDDRFESYANDDFATQTARKYADHNAFVLQMREYFRAK